MDLPASGIRKIQARSLADAGVAGEALAAHPANAPHRVWSVEAEAGRLVIKQNQAPPLRQLAALIWGSHPAQREVDANARLRDARLAVVPIVDGGIEWTGRRCRTWLAQPWAGHTLAAILAGRVEAAEGAVQPETALLGVGRLLAALIEKRRWLREPTLSHFVIDEAGHARLLHATGVKRFWWPGRPRQMSQLMRKRLAEAGASREAIERFTQTLPARAQPRQRR